LRQTSYTLIKSNLCQRDYLIDTHIDLLFIIHTHYKSIFESVSLQSNLFLRSKSTRQTGSEIPRGAKSHQSIIFQYPKGIQHAPSSSGIWSAFTNDKNATLIGVEGTHFLGDLLSTILFFAELGGAILRSRISATLLLQLLMVVEERWNHQTIELRSRSFV